MCLIAIKSMARSKKRIGKYEKPLIIKMSNYFKENGYDTFSHVRFNIAWSGSLSDIDLLLIKNNEITYIEIKSKKDKIKNAYTQIHKIIDFVDYAYIVTNKDVETSNDEKIGLITLTEDVVNIINKAKLIDRKPLKKSIFQLNKKCLLNFYPAKNFHNLYKYELAEKIHSDFNKITLKQCIKEIVLCQKCVLNKCPILKYLN